MFSWLANAWRVPELRKRVLFTALILALYRLGSWVPAPGIDQSAIQQYFNGAGCVLLMWMGELITKRGVGNGISLLIFASILAYAPTGISAWINGGTTERLFFPIVAIAVVVAVVFVQEGQRRIPVQYARRQLGNRQTAGGSTYMPLRVNMAGVIPVIFAAALLALPQTIGSFKPSAQVFINRHFAPNGWTYLIVEAVLIIVFTYFYTAVQFNPVDQADNLRKYGGY